ncbi:MAG: universal stress protein [Mucilaginibacter sp.]
MKTIAVLTDFSERSEHAARYALHLAQKIKANIILFNAFLVPSDTPIAAQVAWPLVDYGDVKTAVEKNLIALTAKFERELAEKSFLGTHKPKISWQCEEGAVANTIPELEENKDVVLLVLATHGADNVSAFMMGNNCRQIIDATKTPLLIIPDGTPIKNIDKFAFATDITYTDVSFINALVSLAKQFSAEVMITNVNPDTPMDSEHDAAVHLFMNDVANEVDYSKIEYRTIPNHDVKKGLEWLIENVKFDMLVMVHRKSSFFEFFYKSSMTKKIAAHTVVPLLVFPYPTASIPLF